jgi:hypothetical protein
MTDSDATSPYRYVDRLVFPEGIMHPFLRAVGSDHVLVSAWGPGCYLVNTATGSIESEPRVSHTITIGSSGLELGTELTSLSVEGDPPICGVAARTGWANVWRLGADAAAELYPRRCGPVNCLALAPHADTIALGLGYYPLDHTEVHAGVETWSVDGSTCIGSRSVPGVSVDVLIWSNNPAGLIALTGARSQDHGFLIMLDADSLALLDVVETNASMYGAGGVFGAGERELVLVSRLVVEIRRAVEPYDIAWQFTPSGSVHDAAICPEREQVLLTTGQLVDLQTRAVVQLEPLPGCIGVAVHPDGGYYGIAETGILRQWIPRKFGR